MRFRAGIISCAALLSLSGAFLIRVGLLDAKPILWAQKNGTDEYLIHLPGIAGERTLDREFVRGLRDGGYAGTLDIYDWTERDPGLSALLARERNQKQAGLVSDRIKRLLTAHPKLKIRLVGHSGGSGIAVWALERLPEEMQVESVVLIAPALSQRYDLSKALAHVRGKVFAFTSEYDSIVLGAGTMLFGTIDGVKEEASGLRGFSVPADADKKQYEKLVTMSYNAGWMNWGNIGDHIGPMLRPFARVVISPILQDREPPATQPLRRMPAATRPATRPRS
jgi:pimeloyl-ACP methyl ester carboxylesterase